LRGGRLRDVKGVWNQERLTRVESFGARAVETSQEEVDPMLELLVLVARLPQNVGQLADHLLEDDWMFPRIGLTIVRDQYIRQLLNDRQRPAAKA
jgi:hypothetical protein